MATATYLQAERAYEIEGTGTPVVFLHGLTFDRRTWRPVIDQLDGSVKSLTWDSASSRDPGTAAVTPTARHGSVARTHDVRDSNGGVALNEFPPGGDP